MGNTLTLNKQRDKRHESATTTVKKIAIVGMPNAGKSQIFNNLTGEYSLVANYPLTTIDLQRVRCVINGEQCEVIDTPALYGLHIQSEQERVVRDMLFSESLDVLVHCIDANQLKQPLALTQDLSELGIPMVIVLTAIDETNKKGLWIDSAGLARRIGVPVIESIALSGKGTAELKDAMLRRARKGLHLVSYGEMVDQGIETLASQLPKDLPHARKTASLLLLDDPFLGQTLTDQYGPPITARITQEINRIKDQCRGNIGHAINNKRSHWAESLAETTTRTHRVKPSRFAAEFARLSRHPVFGPPILLMIIVAMYLLVVNVANLFTGWMETTLWSPVEGWLDAAITTVWLKEFLIGDYGVLSLGLANAFLTIMPILTVFFLAFNVLEDVGYIPNLCVLTKRVFARIGLSGGAIMPLVLGFGCKTMATLSTKSLRSQRERSIAIYLIAFAIPCAPQMALNMSVLGRMGATAFLITFSVLFLVEIGAGLILHKMLKGEKTSAFLQELPAIRLPNVKAVLIKTYYRLWWFIKEAVPVFIYAAVALFAVDKLGILDALKNLLEPVMLGFLGLPIEMTDALILCMARHEAAAGLIIKLIQAGKLNYIQCIVAVTITTCFVPCFANIMAMIKEMGAKRALSMTIAINASAFLIAGLLNWALLLTMGR